MDYICLKPCNMGGVAYIAGDTIPSDAVMPQRTKALIDMGLIAPAIGEAVAILDTTDEGALNDTMYVTLLDKGSDEGTALPVPKDDVAKVIVVLQLNAAEAAEFVRDNLDNTAALELLAHIDKRKTVLAVIEEKTVGEA